MFGKCCAIAVMKKVKKALLGRHPAAAKPAKTLFKVFVKREVKQITRNRTVTHAEQSLS